MNINEYVSKPHLEQQQFLRFLSREQKSIFLKQLAQNAGQDKPVKLEHILNLSPSDRVMITPELLAQEPMFKVEVLKTLHLEVKSSGGGPKQLDRQWQVYEPGIYTLSYKRAALILDLFGPEAEVETQRGRAQEHTEENSPVKRKN